MRYAETVLDLIGRTPLVRLNSVTEGIQATVLVKVEYLNPGGSVKDRIALRMLEEAEKDGRLAPGGTVVEPTSGNTGVGLALVAQQKGYRSVFVTPDKVGQEKRDVLTAYGAEVVVTSTAVAPDSEESYYGVADRLEREIEGAYQPNQFFNPAAPASHYETTGPEIWEDTAGRVTHAVIGAGTGGTITGTGRYLKEVSADREGGPVRIIAADPDGSVYSGGTGRPYYVEGVGEDMWPGNYDPEVPDEVIAVDDAASMAMTRRLAAEEGLLVGGSSGMAVVAGLQAAKDLGPEDVMVIVLPDSGRGYLAKIFNDDWMDAQGFTAERAETVLPDWAYARRRSATPEDDDAAAGPSAPAGGTPAWLDRTVQDVLDGKEGLFPGSVPDVVTATLDTALGDAVDTMVRYGIDVLPVLGARHEVIRLLEVRGAVTTAGLTAALAAGTAGRDTPVGELLEAGMPTVNVSATLAQARTVLDGSPAALAVKDAHVVGVVTGQDLLAAAAEA